MFTKNNYPSDLSEGYELFLKQAQNLVDNRCNKITNIANIAALIAQFMPNINWCGFYLTNNNQLHLGPFIGLPACTIIDFNKGVCGKAAAMKEVLVVADVEKFPDHIACDSASKSEIVLPIIKDDEVVAVLDIDSPVYDRFKEVDKLYLERLVHLLVEQIF